MGEILPTTPWTSSVSDVRARLRVIMLVPAPHRARLAAELKLCRAPLRPYFIESLTAARTALMRDDWAVALAVWPHPISLQLLEEAPESLTRVLVVENLSEEALCSAQRLGAVLCTLDQCATQLSRVLDHVQRTSATPRLRTQRRDFDSEQMRILERLASGGTQEEVLERIVRLIERNSAGTCSILLVDPETGTMHHAAAPGLPRAFVQAIDDTQMGPTAGSCGSAAYTGKAVYVHDIATHPNWAPYRQQALNAGLRACWSTPILSPEGEVLGTFAVYYGEPRDPSSTELRRVASASHLAALTIMRQRHERALRLSEQRYRQLLETSHEGVLTLDLGGHITFANQRAATMLGYAPQELVGVLANDLAHPSERSRVHDVLERRRTGVSEQYELHCITRTGEDLWTIVAASPITDQRGQVIGMLKMLTDISERRAADLALARSEQELRTLFESTGLGLALIDAESRPARCNAALTTMLGYDAEELSRTPLISLVHPDDLPLAAAKRQELSAGERTAQIDLRMRRKDGESIWLRIHTSRLQESAKTSLVGVASFEDIGEKRRAEAIIAEQAALLDRARDAIVVSSLDHEVRFWNASAVKLYGYTREEALGRSKTELLYGDDEARFEQAQREVLTTGAFRGELKHHTKDGREVVVDSSWTLLYDAAGKPESVLAIHTDATERKKLEAHVMLAQRMESLGTLAGGIAHDFNNILAAIRGYLDLATQSLPSDSPAQELLAIVDTATDRAVELVHQILTFSRRKPPKRVRCRLEPVVEEVLRLLRATLPRMIHFEADYAAFDVPVMADATQIHQIVMNLGTNAAQALGSHGTVKIKLAPVQLRERLIGVASEAMPGSYMCLTVSDDGCGMDADTLARIFDPFFTTKAPGAGTGLGLSVVLGIVKDHGGVLTVASKPGFGTRFDIYLPEAAPAEQTGTIALTPKDLRGHGERILCVDDEPALLRLEQSFLSHLGYRVDTFTNPQEALRLFEQQPGEFAAIVSDLAMAEMSGIELSAAVRKIRHDVPILLSSGYVAPEQREQARALGVRTILAKPDFLDPLARELVRALSRSRARNN